MQHMLHDGEQLLRATPDRPVVVIGAGPVGLAAAAHLVERNVPFVVLERGDAVGASVLAWGHVQLFSPWQYCVDAAAERLLQASGWQSPPADTFPTGAELVHDYLQPLAALPVMADHIQLGSEVVQVTRHGLSKSDSHGRKERPFAVQVRSADGRETVIQAAAIIDASGTYTNPNPLGASGVPARGESAATAVCVYGIPEVTGADRLRYADKRVAVVGSGHSAFQVILELLALKQSHPTTQITWVIRRSIDALETIYGGGANDALPERGALGQRIRAAVVTGQLALVCDWRTDEIAQTETGVVLRAGERTLAPVDEVIVTTGFRPDVRMLSELRVGLDEIVEAPRALAPHIDPNLHSCGTVPPHGVRELSHPEPGLFVVGMKSYGRAPTFLLLTGYEQVRSVVAALAGDWQAALDVQLVLPETGVCSGPDAGACCAPVSQSVTMSDVCCAPAPRTVTVHDIAILLDAPAPRCC